MPSKLDKHYLLRNDVQGSSTFWTWKQLQDVVVWRRKHLFKPPHAMSWVVGLNEGALNGMILSFPNVPPCNSRLGAFKIWWFLCFRKGRFEGIEKGSLVKDQEENSNCMVILCKSIFKLFLKWRGCQVFLLVLLRWSLEPGWIIEERRKEIEWCSCIEPFSISVLYICLFENA